MKCKGINSGSYSSNILLIKDRLNKKTQNTFKYMLLRGNKNMSHDNENIKVPEILKNNHR